MHTKASDGKATVMEMAISAREKGLKEIAITDHGFKKTRGLRMKNFESLCTDVELAREQLPILMGIEVNIIDCNGGVDMDTDLLGKFDIVLMGVHIKLFYSPTAFFTFLLPNLFYKLIRYTPKWRIRKNTEIVKRCLKSNKIDIWAHPNRYFKLNVVEAARVCVEKGILIELNGKRISFRPIDFEKMAELGAKFIINSDAHSPGHIGETDRVMEFLKNCDYTEDKIINLKKTYTEYLNEHKILGRSKERNIATEKSRRKRWR